MGKNKSFLIFLILAFSTSVSAVGLNLTESTIEVNKTSGVNHIVSLEIKNTDIFTFFNISFEDNPYISMATIGSIGAGQSITFDATITTNNDISEQIRIRGFYESNIGQGDNEEHDVFVNYDSSTNQYSLDNCNFQVIVGDNVTWHNDAGSTIRLITWPANTPVAGGELADGETFQKTFTEASPFDYYFAIASFPITPVCHVNVLGDSGIVNDPNLDAILNLDVNMEFEPTTISVDIQKTNYTIVLGGKTGGVLTIDNTGGNVAKNVVLEAQWFTFIPNNFDIGVGETKGVSYEIKPIATSSDETNKTYIQNLSIKGNFETIHQNITIFIPFSEINLFGNDTDAETLKYLLEVYCPAHPHSIFCEQDPRIVEVFVNNISDLEFNATFKESQIQDFMRSEVAKEESFMTLINFIKEYIDRESTFKNETRESTKATHLLLEEEIRKRERDSNVVWLIVAGFSSFVIFMVSGYFVYRSRNKAKSGGSAGW